MSMQNYNRLKEAIKIQSKALRKLDASIQEIKDESEAQSKYFQELLWMFKYSFENTGVHPSLATKLSQIVIKREDLCESFGNLNLPGSDLEEKLSRQSEFDSSSGLKEANLRVHKEIERLIKDQLASLDKQNKKLT